VELVFPKNLEAAIFRNTPTDIFPHYKSGLYAPSKVRAVRCPFCIYQAHALSACGGEVQV
jgi:hypothetical protein